VKYKKGIYTIRSKPPKREEYISTLEKLKFCFILLGELQGHINNPSATDLIHFLFKPLNIIGTVSSAYTLRVQSSEKDLLDKLLNHKMLQKLLLWHI